MALENLERSITTNLNNNKAHNLKSAVLRKTGNPTLALDVSTRTTAL
jgi:hypothetical protein